MKESIDRVIHLGVRNPNHLAEEAALALLAITGQPAGKCVFLSSGSEAVEFAVQAARRITGAPLLLTFTTSYLGAFGSAGRKPSQEWHLCDWRALETGDIEHCLAHIPFEKIGGFVFEPGGGSPEFVHFPSRSTISAIAARIKKNGGLLIANEITTGMGRTGKWFGHQHYDFAPDLVAVGKGLGNGFPVSAVAMTQAVADALEQSGLHYAQSHQNNPIGCAVALEVIATMREENWIERGSATCGDLLTALKELQAHSAMIKDVRGRGALLGLELHGRKMTGEQALQRLVAEGFVMGCYGSENPAGTGLRFDPALTVERNDLQRLIDCLHTLLGDG